MSTATYLRTAPSCGIQAGQSVDRTGSIIRGASIVTIGPVPSHNAEFDQTSLDMLAELGNAALNGIKSRYTHPLTEDGLGSLLGWWHNFRIDGERLRADLHLSPTAHTSPRGDLAGYVLDLAETDPVGFGVSIAIPESDLVPGLGSVYRLVRPTKFNAADFVDSPAANDGLFNATKKVITMSASNSEARYRAEFQAAGGEDVVGVCEADYVASCLCTDAGGVAADRPSVADPTSSGGLFSLYDPYEIEFQAAGGEAVLGMTQAEFVAMRRRGTMGYSVPKQTGATPKKKPGSWLTSALGDDPLVMAEDTEFVIR